MAEQAPTKTDINTIFKRLLSIPTNKACFDCGTKNPTWSSITYGVFICIDCSSVHRSLGVHVSFVRSTQLDTNWTWLQLRAMQAGGNSNAISFFKQHGCYTTDSQQKYTSRAAQLYKEKLRNLANTAMREYGIKIHIDSSNPEVTTPENKDADFFEEHTEVISSESLLDTNWEMNNRNKSQPQTITNGNLNSDKDILGPNVDVALSISPSQIEPRKPTIGNRKPAPVKKGLAGKKGLGAQKVKTDFNEIEKEAQMLDKQKEAKSISEPISKEEEERQITSMRLVYQDLSQERKKQEEQLKRVDPKKAEQIERLGMGFGSKGGISHSAISDMKIIEQENPNKVSSFGRTNRDFFEEEFDFMGYGSSSSRNDDRFGSKIEDRTSFMKYSWDSDKSEPKPLPIDSNMSSKSDDSKSGRSRKIIDVSNSGEAQKKFGNAKAISSEQYFGRGESEYEIRANLTRFEGSSSISSADYFGDNASQRSSSYSSGPDFSEIKEGVKQSVTKVAGKLSTLANGVMSSLQRK